MKKFKKVPRFRIKYQFEVSQLIFGFVDDFVILKILIDKNHKVFQKMMVFFQEDLKIFQK